mmetsp:Transcript_14636/g.23877  ORF Transcript_14636/g.23877 Transcript_14636/m.23877 type:complete len:265 (-) Transcript_14636:187-981(-)
MQTTSQEDIERACTAFQKRVHKFIEKYSNRNPYNTTTTTDPQRLSIATKEAKRCIRHANHVLCTLSNKLRALEHALSAFRDVSANDYMTAFTSSLHNKQTQEHVLHQWFANYLRLRDGFVLFESGERRHKHDVDEKTYREFPSRLQSKPRYNDNTRTFSSKLGYTGYGMDEFNDEVVGIRKRLLDQLVIIKGGGGGESSSSSSSLPPSNPFLSAFLFRSISSIFSICASLRSFRSSTFASRSFTFCMASPNARRSFFRLENPVR